ncbi:hypothetical protein E4T89_01040 [Jeotgalicoccus nanhaiensis]|uniref:SH3-like domain-containing protein n=1 Tax=Jeotgalicoccus nanhaiensis TaxID=568603 RepID=A0ABR9XVT7_9STAP|nr:GW dipeptide domain-containing protein [Jeotgalicoccus nanhaiensis]MBF0752840.1 SH3-like domain-containing protein [Jeotgalicoccus nanhaiensis]TFU63000.1 hypothetical protein E4T89_01040 [Jeotgalicoccus nanhaiensis]
MNIKLVNKLKEYIKTPQLFEILVQENINQNIYNEFDINSSERTLGNLNNQVVRVLGLREIDEEFYALIEFGANIIGWTVLENSIFIHPKKLESVKINFDKFTTPDFNRQVNINKDLVLSLKGRLLTSKSFIQVDGVQLEMIYLKGKFQGFVYPRDIIRGIDTSDYLNVDESVKLYRDSNLVIDQEPVAETMKATVTLVFLELNIAKLSTENQTSWVNLDDLDYDTSHLDIENSHLQENFIQMQTNERKKTKSIIESLLKRQIELEKNIDKYETRLNRVENLYNNLRNSKLGKIQVAIWERRGK